MSKQEIIKIFGDRKIRSIWDDEHLKWICGFDNAQGGKLTIGNPVGVVNVLDRRTK